MLVVALFLIGVIVSLLGVVLGGIIAHWEYYLVTLRDWMAEKVKFRTKNGVLCSPEYRPEGYFKEGDRLMVLNTPIQPDFGGGRFLQEFPEGIYEATVVSNEDSDYSDIAIKIQIEEYETEIMDNCPVIMKRWEYDALKNHSLLLNFWIFTTEARWFSPCRFKELFI